MTPTQAKIHARKKAFEAHIVNQARKMVEPESSFVTRPVFSREDYLKKRREDVVAAHWERNRRIIFEQRQNEAEEKTKYLVKRDAETAIGQFFRKLATLQRQEILERILCETLSKYKISRVDFMSDRRHGYLTQPRQEFSYRASTETKSSLPEIGRFIQQDHTTVLYSKRRYHEYQQAIQKGEKLLDKINPSLILMGAAYE